MIFNFLKYIHPTWYYNLRPKCDYAYFPTAAIVAEHGFAIELDRNYKSLEAQQRDLAWRAFQQGYINPNAKEGVDVWCTVQLPLEDEYRFFRKNFHKLWMLYVLLFRLLTLQNPFKEFSAFWQIKKVQ